METRVSREQQLNSSTAEHDLREITDGMWSPRKLPPDVVSKSLQELITDVKKVESEVKLVN